jgi:hypothetical protein
MVNFIDKIGYKTFHKSIDSDHGGCFCDISDRIFKKNATGKQEKIRLDFPYQQLPEHIRCFVDKLRDGKKLREISNNISFDEFCILLLLDVM